LQEQHDQLQRQQQQAVAREAELRASLDTYKTEHMQLLTANAQLVEKCQSLNKRVQVCSALAVPPECTAHAVALALSRNTARLLASFVVTA
jgi:signal transduction protein with GAF and PtsI domain